MLLKKIIKAFKRFNLFGQKTLCVTPAPPVDFVFYVKAPVCHVLLRNLLRQGIDSYLVFVDDQVGFHSDCTNYNNYVRVRSPFSFRMFFRSIFRHEFTVLEDVVNAHRTQIKGALFLTMYDRSEEARFLIERYSHLFSITVTIQHGALGAPDLYFPFLSNVFLARSAADAQVGRSYGLRPDQQIIVVGNLFIDKHVSRHEIADALQRAISQNPRKLLFATRYGLRHNVRFLFIASRVASNKNIVFFKPHPSDRFLIVYAAFLWSLRLIRKPVHLTVYIHSEAYSYLVTESSTLIFDLLARGVAPIIVAEKTQTLPRYVDPLLFRADGDKLCLNDADLYYSHRLDDLINFFYYHNYQSPTSSTVATSCIDVLNRLTKRPVAMPDV